MCIVVAKLYRRHKTNVSLSFRFEVLVVCSVVVVVVAMDIKSVSSFIIYFCAACKVASDKVASDKVASDKVVNDKLRFEGER